MVPVSHSPWQFGARLFGIVSVWMLLMATLVPAAASGSASEEASFIQKVNQTRAAQGLPALTPDVQLTNLARGWAGAMRDGTCGAGNFICHASPISAGVTHPWEKLGENVGTGPNVTAVMDAFIASPGHYANIIDPEFTHIGVGVVWENGRMFTTHRFMKLQQAPPPTTTTTAAPTTTTAAPTTTTAPPTTTTAPANNATTVAPTTTAAPTTTSGNGSGTSGSDDGSVDQQTNPGSEPTDLATNGAPTTPASVRQPVVVLEKRVTVLIDAITVIS